MNKTKEIFVYGFAIFAAFFGAGNLILPPLLGFNSGPDWWLVALGFVTSGTVIPLLALIAHARLQGTMMDFGAKVSPLFSLIFCLCVYIIATTLPIPRTAAVTYEMSVAPYVEISSLLSSTFYFVLVFVFVVNRGKVLDILGKYLTPIIGIILFGIVLIGVFSSGHTMAPSTIETPILNGFLEGYQTYDALAGLLMGGILVISLNMKGNSSFKVKQKIIARSGFVAMFGLLIIYVGLMAIGAKYNGEFSTQITRTELLSSLADKTLGKIGAAFLSVLVGLACFTTAVGVTVGTSDFFKGLFNESRKVYLITAFIACLVGVTVGQMDVRYIINAALPALMFIYPLAVVLILLNVLPKKHATKTVFKWVVFVTFLFSIPDFMGFLVQGEWLQNLKSIIPFAKYNLGWALPAIIVFLICNSPKLLKK
jgi:LIVCS family branched-chain amino acid:cation transporter